MSSSPGERPKLLYKLQSKDAKLDVSRMIKGNVYFKDQVNLAFHDKEMSAFTKGGSTMEIAPGQATFTHPESYLSVRDLNEHGDYTTRIFDPQPYNNGQVELVPSISWGTQQPVDLWQNAMQGKSVPADTPTMWINDLKKRSGLPGGRGWVDITPQSTTIEPYNHFDSRTPNWKVGYNGVPAPPVNGLDYVKWPEDEKVVDVLGRHTGYADSRLGVDTWCGNENEFCQETAPYKVKTVPMSVRRPKMKTVISNLKAGFHSKKGEEAAKIQYQLQNYIKMGRATVEDEEMSIPGKLAHIQGPTALDLYIKKALPVFSSSPEKDLYYKYQDDFIDFYTLKDDNGEWVTDISPGQKMTMRTVRLNGYAYMWRQYEDGRTSNVMVMEESEIPVLKSFGKILSGEK